MSNKLIRDSVHGYIDIPKIIVTEIIDTPVFQRLRQIEQTSMRVLYPSAHHDRFVHSIGVYFLGKLAYDGLIKNIQKESIYSKHESFWKQYKICFYLACLLHDCGHAPMSHSFEYGYMNCDDTEICDSMKERLIKSMLLSDMDLGIEISADFTKQTKQDVEVYFSDAKSITPHEMISAILVSEYFVKEGKIKRVIEEISGEKIQNEDLVFFTNFIQRAIMGIPYGNVKQSQKKHTKKQKEDVFKNCLISLLNGSFFDVDKLDYIIRDSIESGANNISIDVQRILSSLTLVETYNFNEMTEINDLQINNSIYFTGIDGSIYDKSINSNCECALNLEGINIVGSFEGTLHFKGEGNYFESPKSSGLRSGNAKEKLDKSEKISTRAIACKMQGRFNGQIANIEGVESSVVDGVINAKISGKIKGKIIGHIELDAKVPVIYEVGYLKSALSVIEDTLIARNRLYLWIYAHHKVTYNDYVLRKGILYSFLDDEQLELGELEKSKKANQILYSKMNIDNMFLNPNKTYEYLMSDGDLIYNMKCSLAKNNYFAEEWLKRNHRHSVWKSYAEYNSFFVNLSKEEQKILWQLLFDSAYSKDTEYPREANSYEFKNSLLMDFNKTIDDSFDCEYTWIKPMGIKLKEMNSENIYIVLSDNSVKRMKDVVLQSKVSEQYADENFFYLYTSKDLKPEERLKLISFLKTKCNEIKSNVSQS